MAGIRDELTVAWLKETFLLGVDWTLDDGTAYPETIFSDGIESAIDNAQHMFDLELDPIVVEAERHDATSDQREQWFPFHLDKRPLWAVTALRIRYGNVPAVELPLDWVQVTSRGTGSIALVPAQGALHGILAASGLQIALDTVWGGMSYVPNYFEIDYVAGFAQDDGQVTFPKGHAEPVTVTFGRPFPDAGYRVSTRPVAGSDDDQAIAVHVSSRTPQGFVLTPAAAPSDGDLVVSWRASTVPADIKRVIGCRASYPALNVAGDLIGGSGIASWSNSMDGISQSVNTTSSPENGGYSARIRQFERELPALITAIKRRHTPPKMLAI